MNTDGDPGPVPGKGAGGRPRFRRPAILDPASLDEFGTRRLDPALISQIAHETAAVIVHTGRWEADPALAERLVAITDEVGLDTVADLWADRPAQSLPGALWRLYVLREWVRRDPAGAGADYAAGLVYADVAAVVAGVANPPGPQELRDLTDAILRGVFLGDLAVALERAAAFCRVVAAGRASHDIPVIPPAPDHTGPQRPEEGDVQGRSAASVLQTAVDLSACAGLWRRNELT